MIKTLLMLVGFATFTGASVACFGLFSGDRDRPAAESCENLSGPARTECEQGRAPKSR